MDLKSLEFGQRFLQPALSAFALRVQRLNTTRKLTPLDFASLRQLRRDVVLHEEVFRRDTLSQLLPRLNRAEDEANHRQAPDGEARREGGSCCLRREGQSLAPSHNEQTQLAE